MNKERLLAAGIDFDDAVHRCTGDESLYEELLHLIIADTNILQARKTLDEKDFDKFYTHAHEIKGMSGTVSFTKVYELASELVELYRANKFDSIPALFNEMEEAYNVAIEAVRKELD